MIREWPYTKEALFNLYEPQLKEVGGIEIGRTYMKESDNMERLEIKLVLLISDLEKKAKAAQSRLPYQLISAY